MELFANTWTCRLESSCRGLKKQPQESITQNAPTQPQHDRIEMKQRCGSDRDTLISWQDALVEKTKSASGCGEVAIRLNESNLRKAAAHSSSSFSLSVKTSPSPVGSACWPALVEVSRSGPPGVCVLWVSAPKDAARDKTRIFRPGNPL